MSKSIIYKKIINHDPVTFILRIKDGFNIPIPGKYMIISIESKKPII